MSSHIVPTSAFYRGVGYRTGLILWCAADSRGVLAPVGLASSTRFSRRLASLPSATPPMS
jgi:hypothetical protein